MPTQTLEERCQVGLSTQDKHLQRERWNLNTQASASTATGEVCCRELHLEEQNAHPGSATGEWHQAQRGSAARAPIQRDTTELLQYSM